MTRDEIRHFGNGIWLGFVLGMLFTGFVVVPLGAAAGKLAKADWVFFHPAGTAR
jgi:hypothetical protein